MLLVKKLITMFQVNITREKIFLKMYDTDGSLQGASSNAKMLHFVAIFFLYFHSRPSILSLPSPLSSVFPYLSLSHFTPPVIFLRFYNEL